MNRVPEEEESVASRAPRVPDRRRGRRPVRVRQDEAEQSRRARRPPASGSRYEAQRNEHGNNSRQQFNERPSRAHRASLQTGRPLAISQVTLGLLSRALHFVLGRDDPQLFREQTAASRAMTLCLRGDRQLKRSSASSRNFECRLASFGINSRT